MTHRKYGRAMERADIPPQNGAVVGCYSTHLYCGHPEHIEGYPGRECDVMEELTGETRGETLRTARKAGWYISRDEQRVLCPYHAKQVPR